MDPRFFEEAYQGDPPPWDIGRAQTAFVELEREGLLKGELLDAGCGTGENALHFAARGHRVTGVDCVEKAIRLAREKARARNLENLAGFIIEDALHLERLNRRFDTVIDCGLFHIFSDTLRARYVESLSHAVAPGGRLFMLCFSEAVPGEGGPRRVSKPEILAAFKDWQVRELRPALFEASIGSGAFPSWLAIIER